MNDALPRWQKTLVYLVALSLFMGLFWVWRQGVVMVLAFGAAVSAVRLLLVLMPWWRT